MSKEGQTIGIAKQFSVPNGKRGTGRYNRDVVLRKLIIYYENIIIILSKTMCS